MKKLILLLILLIAAALPAVPYYIGTTVEETIRTEMKEAAKDAALSGFDVELVDYQRGFLDATATTRVSILVPQGKEKESISFDMKHNISHIPQIDKQVIATVDSELVLSDEIAEKVDQLFQGQSPLEMKTLIFFDGHQEGTINSPSAYGQISGKKTVSVDWQGLTGSVWQDAGRDNITFKIHLPGVTVSPLQDEPVADNSAEPDIAQVSVAESSDAQSVALKGLRYSGNMQRGESGMWHGDAAGSISSISANIEDKGMPLTLLINSIDIKGQQSESNGMINANGALTANSINVNGFLLSNAIYDIAIENIDAGAMVAWQETAGKMMKGEVDPKNPMEPMVEHIPALFNAHPVIKINDISVDSPMGRFAFKMNTSVNGEWDDMILQNPAMAIPMLKVDLNADLPRNIVVSAIKDKVRNTLLMQAAMSDTEMSAEDIEAAASQAVEQQLGAMIAQGFVQESEGQLQSHIVFDAGKLTINGVDASPMLGGMM